MPSISPFRNGLPAFQGVVAPRITPNSTAVRRCSEELVADLPEHHRERLFTGLAQLRRADDMGQWRAALYAAIALTHGEAEARLRLGRFDTRIQG